MAKGKSKGKGKGRAGDGMVRISTFVRADQLAKLRQIQDTTGAPVAFQIRRALDEALGTTPEKGRRA